MLQSLSLEIAAGLAAYLFSYWKLWQQAAMRTQMRLARSSQAPVRCMAFLALADVAIRLALLPLTHIPIPLYHDEFSYLLGADTFAHGRLTNPTPPMAAALETIHINMWPTYQTMYMPGTSLLLTFGRLLHCPWISVLLITAVFSAAIYWMISAWLPQPYALVGGIVALGIAANLNWWFDNYFCIALLSLGGTLVLGSVPRIFRDRTWNFSVPLGAGLLILMFTRPYEGFCIAFPCVAVLVWKLRGAGARKLASMAATPLAMLALGMVWLLYYNWRGTGHPLLFPYMLDFRTYHITGPFLFSPQRPLPHYRLDVLRRFYIFAEVPQYQFMHQHPWQYLARKIWIYYFTYLFGVGLLLLPGVWYLIRRRREELNPVLLASSAGFCINVALMGWTPFPQYAAPAAPLLLLIVMLGVRAIGRAERRFFHGAQFLRGLALAELMLGLSLFGLRISEALDFPEPQYVSRDRAEVAREVLSHPGKQLCLVLYGPQHEAWQEWVFNGADPENERLVWARSLGSASDRAVIAAYPGRQVWLVNPDSGNKLLTPYASESVRSGNRSQGETPASVGASDGNKGH